MNSAFKVPVATAKAEPGKHQTASKSSSDTMAISRMFKNDVMATWYTAPKCPQCSQTFKVIPRNAKPLILRCGHLTCEQCASSTCQNWQITCAVCGEISRKDRTPISMQFPIDLHLSGFLQYLEFKAPHHLDYTTSIASASSTPIKSVRKTSSAAVAAAAAVDLRQLCYECQVTLTDRLCVQCNMAFCLACFKKVHHSARSLKRHELRHSGAGAASLHPDSGQLEKFGAEHTACRRHPGVEQKYYCKPCGQAICGECKRERHDQHGNVVALLLENRQTVPKLRELMTTLQMAKQTTDQSAQHIATELVSNIQRSAAKSAQDVFEHFTRLHTQLQVRQQSVTAELKARAQRSIAHAQQLAPLLRTSGETFTQVMGRIEALCQNVPANVSLPKLIGEVNMMLERAPCTLSYDVDAHFRIQTTDTNLTLSDSGPGNQPHLMSYLGFPIDQTEKNTTKQRFAHNTTAHNVTAHNSTIGPPTMGNGTIKKRRSVFAPIPPGLAQTNQSSVFNCSLMSQLSGAKPMLVTAQKMYISHIDTPHQFYVQTIDYHTNADSDLEACKAHALYASTPQHIEAGGMYLLRVSNKADTGAWHRVRVLRADAGSDCGAAAEVAYDVFFLDYGKRDRVKGSGRFRTISVELATKPAGARACSLHSLQPADGVAWRKDAKVFMSTIIQQNPVEIYTVSTGEPLVVDVLTTHRRYTTSLRDALLFAKMALADNTGNSHSKKLVIHQIERLKEKRMLVEHASPRCPQLAVNVFHKVRVISVVSPHEFYVLLESDYDRYFAVTKRLQLHYDSGAATATANLMPHPSVNQLCAVHHSDQWHRARIQQCEGGHSGCARVWLLDNACTVTVPCGQLFELQPEFADATETIACCTLSDVEPPVDAETEEGEWPAEATIMLRQLTERAQVLAYVVRAARKPHQRNAVLLYNTMTDGARFNVNATLVKRGLALGLGNFDSEADGIRFQEGGGGRFGARLSHDGVAASADANVSCAAAAAAADAQRQQRDPRKLVQVLHMVSPGEFYVTHKRYVAGMETMQAQIQLHMQNNSGRECNDDAQPQHNWSTGDACLVRDDDNRWYRGRIETMLPQKITVFLRDRGSLSIVRTADAGRHLAVIPDRFQFVRNAAQRCRMACVKPTNGLDSWSSAAVDKFRTLLDEFATIAVSVHGERIGPAASVLVWVRCTESCDPLRPTVYRWLNVNKMLLSCGLVHMTEQFPSIDCDRPAAVQLFGGSDSADDGEQQFDEWLSKLMAEQHQKRPALTGPAVDHEDDDAESTNEPQDCRQLFVDVEAYGQRGDWLAAVPVVRTNFTAIVTYVDNNAVLYLHEHAQADALENIKNALNRDRQVDDAMQLNAGWRAGVGDSCLAPFHQDNLFYRAVVLKVTEALAEATIQFVDYGNVEQCALGALRPPALLHVPIQANKYALANLRPLRSDGDLWPRMTLDYLHAQVVGKLSSVATCAAVPDVVAMHVGPAIQPCRLIAESVDIHQLMLEKGLACVAEPYDAKRSGQQQVLKQRNQVPKKSVPFPKFGDVFNTPKVVSQPVVKSLPKEREAVKENQRPASDQVIPVQPNPVHTIDTTDTGMTFEQYTNFFDNEEKKKLHAIASSISDSSDDNEPALDPTISYSHLPSESDTDDAANGGRDAYAISTANTSQTFDPLDTSTLINAPSAAVRRNSNTLRHWSIHKPFTTFKTIPLTTATAPFTAQALTLLNALNIWLQPTDCTDFRARRDRMASLIRTSPHEPIAVSAVRPGLRCLAVYQEDAQLYRAMVKRYDAVLDEVTLVYVDYMNVELLPARCLFAYPRALDEFALEVVHVRLHGVQIRRRVRESDVERRMSDVLQDKQFTVRVVRVAEDGVPEVELLRESDGRLMYQELLSERFLVEERKQ